MSGDAPAEVELDRLRRMIADDPTAAARQLRNRLVDNPLEAKAYRLLASALKQARTQGNSVGVVEVSLPGGGLRLAQAVEALQRDDLPTAEKIVRALLLDRPDDADALRLMAELARQLDYAEEAEELLGLAIEVQPLSAQPLLDLARLLRAQKRHGAAVDILDRALQLQPDDANTLLFRATELGHAGRFEEAAANLHQLLQRTPSRAEVWISYAQVLKTLGRRDQCISALRHALELSPRLGVAWWSLSELKTYRFTDAEVDRMVEALAHPGLGKSDRVHLNFALGKTFEDRGQWQQAFAHYAAGNQDRLSDFRTDYGELRTYVAAARRTFDRRFFDERRDFGYHARDPIFILGMTRSGSTLVEQILSSHSQVEGTMELPDLPQLARRVSQGMDSYAERLASLGGDELAALGHAYLDRTRAYRKTDRPFFIDKMPHNWMHLPLIQLALPNARIIDTRRHPLACCFSNFKQHFATGQAFSYSQEELGRFYVQYVRLTAHMDTVLPGRVYRVYHERLVADTEGEVRRLLDHLDLPFEETCLRFHESKRAVRTASSEQVRRPIDQSLTEQWRPFEQWLGPLKEALGPVLESYPEAPEFLD